jgi:hypothetical protein
MKISSLSLAIALAGIVFALPAAAGTAQSVTLTVVRTYDEPQSSYKLRFSGSVSSGRAGEDVSVMQQTCGYSFSTAVAATQTREGGFWEAEPNYIVIADSATYRARWKNELSDPVAIRPEIYVGVRKLRRGRFQVSVSTGDVQQKMKGRTVVLQRLKAGTWTNLQRARLAFGPLRDASAAAFVATFTVRQRGWTLRALVPAKTAAPCFKTNVTEKWTS